jgi:hypothetical protein
MNQRALAIVAIVMGIGIGSMIPLFSSTTNVQPQPSARYESVLPSPTNDIPVQVPVSVINSPATPGQADYGSLNPPQPAYQTAPAIESWQPRYQSQEPMYQAAPPIEDSQTIYQSPVAAYVPPAPSGAINVQTGDYYPGVAGGVVNPQTGAFYQNVAGGFVNTQTGEFAPQVGQ